jgi:hypothetical protein
VFDDRGHPAFGIADDAAVAGGVGEFGDQHRQPGARRQQPLQAVGRDQRDIPVQHQHLRAIGHLRHRLLQRMAGAELLRLLDPMQVLLFGECGLHRVAAVAMDHMNAVGCERERGLDDMGQHRPSRDLLQHLGLGRVHAFALAGGEDHDVQGGGHGRPARGKRQFYG